MDIVLKISNDNRIEYVCKIIPNGNYDDMSIVDVLPEGDLSDY